jgi:hypothetical protein
MATRYTLTVINNPSRSGGFAVFQQPPPRVGSVLPLAWFAMPTAPHTQVSFEWTLDDNPLPSDSGVPDARTVFTPQHDYGVAFGEFTHGQVLDVGNITGAVEVTFSGPTTSHTVTLGLDNELSVS